MKRRHLPPLPPHPPEGTIFDNEGRPVPIERVTATHAYLMSCVQYHSFRDLDTGKDYDLAAQRRARRGGGRA